MRYFVFVLFCLISTISLPVRAADNFNIVPIATDLEYPWSLVFLPEGDYLITQRGGELVRITPDGKKTEIKGIPPVVSRRQGGLLGLALSPDFTEDRTIFFSYTGRGQGGTGTEVASAQLDFDKVYNVNVIFKAAPKMRSDVHFGSRLLFAPDGTLFVTLGERFDMKQAQDTSNHLGSIIRINPDGSVPEDNPFTGKDGYKPEIYSYGHRNVQGIAIQPGTETIWAHEHGPKGGDEVNILKPGANYGWPEITYGIDYDGDIISTKTEAPGMEQPVIYWVPSIAPSGMTFYNGNKFPDWKGDIFVGALAGTHLRRLHVEGTKITEQEAFLEDRGERIREVQTGPDGYLYFLTDAHDGGLYRIEPK